MIRHTDADREREHRLAGHVADTLGLTMYRMPELSPVDYLASNRVGRIVGVWEFKCRTCAPDAYPSLIVDAAKLLELTRWALLSQCRAYVAAGYADGSVWVVELAGAPVEVTMGGRTDRADPHDWEPVAHLPREWFRRLA